MIYSGLDCVKEFHDKTCLTLTATIYKTKYPDQIMSSLELSSYIHVNAVVFPCIYLCVCMCMSMGKRARMRMGIV